MYLVILIKIKLYATRFPDSWNKWSCGFLLPRYFHFYKRMESEHYMSPWTNLIYTTLEKLHFCLGFFVTYTSVNEGVTNAASIFKLNGYGLVTQVYKTTLFQIIRQDFIILPCETDKTPPAQHNTGNKLLPKLLKYMVTQLIHTEQKIDPQGMNKVNIATLINHQLH